MVLRETKSIILTVLLIIFVNTELYSQDKNYLSVNWVTKSGKSINGYIKPNISGNNIIHAKLLDGTRRQLLADSITYIQHNDEIIFRTHEVIFQGKKEYIFCKLVFSGSADLFSGKHQAVGNLYFIYIDDKMLYVNRTELKQFYNNVLGSCFDESLSKNYTYSESSITKVLKNYSTCKDPNIEINDNPLNSYKINYSIGAKVSYTNGSFKFPDGARYAQGDYSNFSSLSLGIIGVVHISPKIFIQTEFSRLRKQSEADPVITGTVFVTNENLELEAVDITSKVTFDLTYLDWPLFVGYQFLNGRFKPFVGAGVNCGFLLSGEIIDEPYSLKPPDEGPPYYKFNNFDFGLLALIGADFQISPRSYLQVYLKYVISTTDYILFRNGQVPGGDGMGSSNLDTKRFEVSLGYTFSFGRK